MLQLSVIPPQEVSSKFNKNDSKDLSFLHNGFLTICRFSVQDLFNLMQLLCEIQDDYSKHNYGFSVVGSTFRITLKQTGCQIEKVTYHKSCNFLSRSNTTDS